ncbi:MpaA2 family daptide-type RiPP [Microbacterium sp. NRRL B-14842]
MSVPFAGRVPTLWHGPRARETTGRLTAGRDTLVIADAAVAHTFPTAQQVRRMTVDASAVDEVGVLLIADEIIRRPPEVIVAVGGGSVLDASKIAALALSPGRLFDFALRHAATAALTVLPDAPPPVDIIAMPSTLGTSSETNSVAILRNRYGSRLLIGRPLRPRHAVLDPERLATLSPAAVREGALEAFLRVAGASTSPRTERAERDARLLGRALLEVAAGEAISAAGRLRLARLSAATQRTAALRGPDPYSARHWYLANEVAFHLGVRKMTATVAVIAAVWRRIGAGDLRWGDRVSLDAFWTGVVGATGLPREPAAGIAALVDQADLPSPPRPSARRSIGSPLRSRPPGETTDPCCAESVPRTSAPCSTTPGGARPRSAIAGPEPLRGGDVNERQHGDEHPVPGARPDGGAQLGQLLPGRDRRAGPHRDRRGSRHLMPPGRIRIRQRKEGRMTAALPALEFTELEAMDAPGDADDYIRGFAVGVIIGILALT